ncbi:MAG: hypothetical protein JWM32_12 [Verrucomicrobia bacterium]|nr:hypothetical protein [Verrucomicrobiota bacterium]
MRKAVFLLLFVTTALIGRSQELETGNVHLSGAGVRGQLVAVVSAQLAAFRAGDWEKAYTLAAPSFQGVVSRQAFATLIMRNYPIVWKNTRAEFGVPSDNGRVGIVPVRIFGEGGSEAYTWLLVKETGGWRVTGVVPQRTTGGA